jgi:hypothetical protein
VKAVIAGALKLVRGTNYFETLVPMKNDVFWVVTPCGSCKNRRFGGTWRLLHQSGKIGALGTTQAATSNRRGISSQRTSVASCSLCCS